MYKTKLITTLGAICLIVVSIVAMATSAKKNFGATQATPFLGSAINSFVNVSTTPILVLASNTGRNSASVCSPAANANVWLSVFAAGTTPTTTTGTSTYFASSTGRLLSPNSCYSIDANNLLTGVVWGISQSIASTSQPLSVMDLSGR